MPLRHLAPRLTEGWFIDLLPPVANELRDVHARLPRVEAVKQHALLQRREWIHRRLRLEVGFHPERHRPNFCPIFLDFCQGRFHIFMLSSFVLAVSPDLAMARERTDGCVSLSDRRGNLVHWAKA